MTSRIVRDTIIILAALAFLLSAIAILRSETGDAVLTAGIGLLLAVVFLQAHVRQMARNHAARLSRGH